MWNAESLIRKRNNEINRKNRYHRIGRLFLLMLFLGITSVTVYAYEVIPGLEGDFRLKAENQDEDNFIFLEWEDVGADYFYTIYQSDDEMNTWQTRSATYGKEINVLNVYPVAGGDGLKTWMEDYGYGNGLITVDKVLLSQFNLDPDSYLKNAAGEYLYDVVVFGFWNWNGGNMTIYDLTITARDATEEYMKSGYGVLFGHDTITRRDGQNHPNFVYLAETYMNMETHESTAVIKNIGNTIIKSVNDGFLLQYPWEIEYDAELTVPMSHSFGQVANGIIWMKYVEPFHASYPGPEVISESGGSNNFYLATWNNTAMIQTGHTTGSSVESEQKVLANVLMYLAQYTDETTASDYSASDKAAPAKPESEWGSSVKTLTLTAEDQGTPYWYKVEATSKHSSSVKVSDTVLEYCKTGIHGYYIIEDESGYTEFDVNTALFVPASADGTLEYTMTGLKNYLHVKAVDFAGNISEAARISPMDPDWELDIEKSLDMAAEQDQDFVFEISYRTEVNGPAEDIFYSVLSVAAGDDAGKVTLCNISPGIYRIREKETNWTYQLNIFSAEEQELTLLDPKKTSGSVSYQNDEITTSWISGNTKVVNSLKNIE